MDTLIAAQPFGRQMPFSFLWEKLIVLLNYRGAPELVPARVGIFEGTPVVNDEFVDSVRQGKCDYIRGDIERLTRHGIRVSVRTRDEKPGEGKETKDYHGDVLVLATGFHKPQISFFEEDLFPESYDVCLLSCEQCQTFADIHSECSVPTCTCRTSLRRIGLSS